MSNADNLIKPDNSEDMENSMAFQQVAPGSRRHRDFVRAYRSWVQFIDSP